MQSKFKLFEVQFFVTEMFNGYKYVFVTMWNFLQYFTTKPFSLSGQVAHIMARKTCSAS